MQQDSMISTRMMKQISSQSQINSDIFSPPPYSSIFFNSSSSPPPLTSSSTFDIKSTRTTSKINAEVAKNLKLIMAEHKELLNRYAICLNQLRITFKESETLRQENTNLRLANAELSNHVNLLIQATFENRNAYKTTPFYEEEKEEERESGEWSGGLTLSQSPMSMAESDSQVENEKDEDNRVSLPKSISVRSNGYLKCEDSSTVRTPTRIRASTPVNNGPKKVYVRGGGRKNGPIELEVYNQGMFKTELCNKWQETGSCPYGDHCQFAHGIDELRPVIRHPRYKTEVCRMVLTGDPCPYGHRCHFRHALTDQEKLMLPFKLE